MVGLITDTHDNKRSVKEAVRLFNDRETGLVLHGGDYVAPFNAGWMASLEATMVGVFGNNDGERFGLRAQFEQVGQIHRSPHPFDYEGKRFLLMHEPDQVDALAAGGSFDVIVYGHLHEIDIREGDALVVSPGEAGGWTTGRATAGILDLQEMRVEIVDLW